MENNDIVSVYINFVELDFAKHILELDKMKKMNRVFGGFTLAELLMAVLVISIIMVALAPVITKRVMDNVKVNIFKNDGELFLYSTTNPTCTPATDGQKSVDCIFTPPQGVNKVSAVIVSGGGGGAGAASPALTYDMTETAASPTTATSQTKTLNITDTMKEVVITYMTGGGGGGSAGAYANTTDGIMSQADCDKYGALFVEAKYNGTGKNICITRYNAGDPPGPSIAPSTKIVNTDLGQSCTGNDCCWQGTLTANINDCTESYAGTDGSITTYSGCNRTVCTYPAATAACALYAPVDTNPGDWRLPIEKEIGAWSSTGVGSFSIGKGSAGMQLCSYFPNYKKAISCSSMSGLCLGANSNSCQPAQVWGMNRSATALYLDGVVASSGKPSNVAGSVRCVYEKNTPSYKPYGGGGGGAAPYIKNYAIPEDVLNANIGGRIEIFAGAGGKGSDVTSGAGISSEAGEVGASSYVRIYSPENVLVWGISVRGGDYAKKTVLFENGNGSSEAGKETPINGGSCQVYNGTSWSNINCTGVGVAGQKGQLAEEVSNNPRGGNGGGSMYSSDFVTGGGVGGSEYNTVGGNGTNWGAGGGGGSVYTTYDPDTGAPVANKGKGGNGGNGIVQINYGESLQVAGGGAGGGGAFARIVDLEVVPGQEYAIRVGGGGTGGSANNPGQNGGQSWVKIGATTYSLDGGEGGKVGTAQTQTAAVVHGLGGSGSFVQSSVADASEDYYDGDDGTAGDSVVDDLTGRVIGSSGGCGGESGIGSIGSTGGMNICTEGATINGINATPLTFLSPGNVFNQSVYGTAGAGGGGGGWDRREGHYINLGNGSSGLDGYVYVFWTDHD